MMFKGYSDWLLHMMGLKKQHEQRISAISFKQRLKVVSAAFFALWLVANISEFFLSGTSHTLLLASMGASAVLLFGLPGSPLAKPAVFFWGHLLSAAIGLMFSHLLSNFALMTACTVAVVIFVMYLFEAMHPPGGATALVPVIATTTGPAPALDFLLFPVSLNLLLMLTVSLLLQRYLLKPNQVNPGPGTPETRDLPPLSRSRLQKKDIQAAMQEFSSVLDISEADLVQLFSLAQQQAMNRQSSPLQCADIMARDLITVSPETPLHQAWQLLRRHKISMLPVIDADDCLVGVISVPDFLKDLAMPELTGTRQHLHSLRLHLQMKWLSRQTGQQSTVGQKMSTRLIVAAPQDPIATLVPLLANNGLHQVPIVTTNKQLCGVVSQSDLMAALAPHAMAMQL
jgi:CBS domain-containing membrane protein